MTDLFHKLADRGYLVLPIAPQSKVPSKYDPATYSWIHYKGWSKLDNNPAKLDIWKTWPNVGLGVLTGKIIALDLDILHEKLLAQMMLILHDTIGVSPLARQGRAPKLLLLYQTNDVVTKLRSKEYSLEDTPKNQVEVLGVGQQFVAYGIHPDTNQPYRWLDKQPTEILAENIPFITANQLTQILEEFERLAESLGATPISAGVTSNETHISSTALSDKRNLARQALAHIPNDDIHYDEWIKTGMAIKAAFSEDEATGLELWLEFSDKSGKSNPALSEEKFATFRPTAIGAATLYYKAQQHGWFNPNPVEASDPSLDFAPVPDMGNPISPKPSRLFMLTPKDISLDTSRTSLVHGVIDHGAMSVMYGESNVGKTFVAMDIAFHIAAGIPWNNRRTTQGAVLYVAAEGGRGAKDRILALRQQHNLHDFPLFLVPCPVDLLRKDADTKPLITLAQQCPPLSLVVIDTLSRALAGGNENSSDDMGAYVMNADRIREATRAHVMTIHHSGKDTSKGARGHSLLRAATDTEIEIADNQLKITKQRDMEMLPPSGFTLIPHQLGTTAEGDHISSCTVEWKATIVSDFAEAEDLNYRDRALLEALKHLSAGLSSPKDSVTRTDWFAHAKLDDIWPESFETAKRHMQNSQHILVTKGYVLRVGKSHFKLVKNTLEIDPFS